MADLSDIRENVRRRYANAAKAAGASLGCGDPTAVADLHEGETVLDLGSGAGADVLISARRVHEHATSAIIRARKPAAIACCAPVEQADCCAPSAKADCCGPAEAHASEPCACR